MTGFNYLKFICGFCSLLHWCSTAIAWLRWINWFTATSHSIIDSILMDSPTVGFRFCQFICFDLTIWSILLEHSNYNAKRKERDVHVVRLWRDREKETIKCEISIYYHFPNGYCWRRMELPTIVYGKAHALAVNNRHSNHEQTLHEFPFFQLCGPWTHRANLENGRRDKTSKWNSSSCGSARVRCMDTNFTF